MSSPLNRPDVFERLGKSDYFITDIFAHYNQVAAKSYLQIDVAEDRLQDAFTLWQSDLERVGDREYGGGQLDQYKMAGYLCFWLRRESPIIAISESPQMGRLEAGNDVIQELVDDQEFLYKYANEYLAFETGFRLCLNVEIWRADKTLRRFVVPKRSFLHDVSNVLKAKSISPHSLYLIYYALFDGVYDVAVAK